MSPVTPHPLPMNYAQLREHARWLAESHNIKQGLSKDRLLERLKQNLYSTHVLPMSWIEHH